MDLKVTDVQRLLRQHANLGHDVITDPRTAHLGEVNDPLAGNKPFGMAIAHHLYVPEKWKTWESVPLSTYLSHGEKPSITRVDSVIEPSAGQLTHRTAELLHPRTVLGDWADQGGKSHTFGDAFGQSHLNYKWRLGHVLSGNPHKNTSESLHETLKKHVAAPLTYETKNVKTGESHIHPENEQGWHPKEAITDLADLDFPFSGRIQVFHSSGAYSYNPQTEQLLEVF